MKAPSLFTRHLSRLLQLLATLILAGTRADANSYTWTNGSANSLWNTTSGNWATTSGTTWVGNSDAVFGATGAGAITVSGTQTIRSLSVNAGSYSLTGGKINLGAVTTAFTINSNLSMGLVIGGGANGLIISGTGTLTLTGVNTFTGGTIVSSGSLRIGSANALGSTAGTLAVNGGTLDLNGHSVAVGLLSGNNGGVITTTSSAALVFTGSSASDGVYGGTIQNGVGTLGLTKQGAGTLTLTGSNTYLGMTTVEGGVLSASNLYGIGEGPLQVANGAKLDLSFSGQAWVTQLVLGGVSQPSGTYGSTNSSATIKNDTYFSGSGVVSVSALIDHTGAATTSMTTADQAWAVGNWAGVRSALAPVIGDLRLSGQWRSIAHLRYARSYLAEGNPTAASAVFAIIAANTGYPKIHQTEGEECQAEADRVALGLPGRDPELSRVRVPSAPTPGRVLYVAPNGNDGNPGTLGLPLATLSAALAANRAAVPVLGGATIQMADGAYSIAGTIALTSADSGSAGAPLTIRAATPGNAVLNGAKRLSGFTLVTDPAVLARLPEEARGKVMQCNLAALGITDYGSIQQWGFEHTTPPLVGLVVNGMPQTLARWPNSGFVQPAGLIDAGDRATGRPQTISFSNDRHSRWSGATDGWLYGFLGNSWYDGTVKIGSINPQAKTLTTAFCYIAWGWPAFSANGTYYAFNLLEEIDQPGEWYLNRSSGVLYWYPSVDPATAAIDLTMLSQTMLTADNVNQVRIEGLVFESSRSNGLALNNSSDCIVAGCTIRNLSGSGISINGGQRDWVVGCDLHSLGQGGCSVTGGDRVTLTRGDHVVANCRFRDLGRVDQSWALGIYGVGTRVTHCEFRECVAGGVWVSGNDHTVEYNEIRDCLWTNDDSAVISLWGNPTYRGNLFRFNHFTHIGGGVTVGGVETHIFGQAGIRLDDAISGQTIYGNIFDHFTTAKTNWTLGSVGVNGGRENIFDNNLMIDCRTAKSGGYYGTGSWYSGWTEPPTSILPLYIERYPELANLYDGKGLNFVWRSASFRCAETAFQTYGQTSSPNWEYIANATSASDPGFVLGDEVRKIIAPSLFWNLSMRPIPVDEIGLYADTTHDGWVDGSATFYWNGASGNWNSTVGSWSADAGSPGSAAWENHRYHNAVFGGAGGTITLTESIVAESLAFASNGYTLSGTSPIVLNSSVSELNVSGFGAMIAAGLTGPGGINVTGWGTLTLSGSNSYQGATAIKIGTLALGAHNSLPITSAVTLGDGGVANGAKFSLNGYNQQLANLWASGNGDNNSPGSGLNNYVVNGSSSPATLTLNIENGTNVFRGVLGGTDANQKNFSMVKTGPGWLTLTRGKTYTGETTVAAGTLELNSNFYAGPTASGTFNIGSGAAMVLSGQLDNYCFDKVTLNFQGGGGGAFIENGLDSFYCTVLNGMTIRTNGGVRNVINLAAGAGLNSNGSNLAFDIIRGIDATSDLTVSVPLYGSGSVKKQGNGILSIEKAQSYSGATTVKAGKLVYQSTYASGSHSIASGATLEINVDSGSRDFASTIFSGSGTLLKTGSGQTLWGSTAAVFALGSGALIDVQSGTFVAGSSSNEVWINNLADLNVAAGSLFNGVEANVRVNKITGAGIIMTGYSGAGYQCLTIGVDNGSCQFDGVIANGVGVGNLVKSGIGTITLAGANTYTGTTTVSAGSLILAATGSLQFSPALNGNCNRITGSGAAIFNGSFVIDLTNAQTVSGNSWNLVNTGALTATFAASFNVPGFTKNANIWTKVDGSTTWAFSEATGNLTVSVQTGFAAWIANFPGLTDSTPAGDPDHDGISNLLEFVLGGSPVAPDRIIAPAFSSTATDFVFTFRRRMDSKANVVLSVEYGTDLLHWNSIVIPAVSGILGVLNFTITQESPSAESVIVRIPKGTNPEIFARLKAFVNP